MPRKRIRNWPIICRSYWVKPIEKELPKEVMDVVFKMNQLWNRFVEANETARGKYQEILAEDSEMAQLMPELERLNEKIENSVS